MSSQTRYHKQQQTSNKKKKTHAHVLPIKSSEIPRATLHHEVIYIFDWYLVGAVIIMIDCGLLIWSSAVIYWLGRRKLFSKHQQLMSIWWNYLFVHHTVILLPWKLVLFLPIFYNWRGRTSTTSLGGSLFIKLRIHATTFKVKHVVNLVKGSKNQKSGRRVTLVIWLWIVIRNSTITSYGCTKVYMYMCTCARVLIFVAVEIAVPWKCNRCWRLCGRLWSKPLPFLLQRGA